jgi:hypothetical protein
MSVIFLFPLKFQLFFYIEFCWETFFGIHKIASFSGIMDFWILEGFIGGNFFDVIFI